MQRKSDVLNLAWRLVRTGTCCVNVLGLAVCPCLPKVVEMFGHGCVMGQQSPSDSPTYPQLCWGYCARLEPWSDFSRLLEGQWHSCSVSGREPGSDVFALLQSAVPEMVLIASLWWWLVPLY